MLQKWKIILTNWINCYKNENEKIQQNVTPENLFKIFTQVHESLRVDDSNSSEFEVNTIKDFIVEKYPQFKFENGSVEVTTEEDIYIAASLLLFFICVNSKNEDIKRIMCSKLGVRDQETILKFSKCLMECSPLLYADVEAAITEACGEEPPGTVAETPPPLRSLHSEVRRLQAALDAERFDRNYLQDELARTNLKLDKLTKDKEQYKLDILNLKAKISLCCGTEHEDRSEARADESRLHRQLSELEERLVDTQGRLDDVQHERDTYKKKVEELKQERDKWLTLSQHEADRTGQLTDQLETERRTVQSLKDLVSELRQHNRNNGLDASSLECDDPDASIQSLNNMSVCSEACANVVEVQLSEERAKIEVLKQQIQGLKDQLDETNLKFESEKLFLEATLSEKSNDISKLKDRINEEIEEKKHLQSRYGQEVENLNCRIVELEQLITDNEKRAKTELDEKVCEIQALQKQFAEETKKSGNMIKNLQIELDAEKYAQLKIKDEFDTQIMKMNEKVLNRNNELVELQNNIISKSEMIEIIQSDLRREKQCRDELSNACNDQLLQLNDQRMAIEEDIRQKSQQIAECEKYLQEKDLAIEKLSNEVHKLETSVSSLEEKCHHRDSKINEKQKEIEFLNDVFQKEHEKLAHKLDERNATIKSLQMQLQNEIEFKIELQNELSQLKTSQASLVEEIKQVKSNCKAELLDNKKTLDAMDTQLKAEKKYNEDLKLECAKMNENLQKLSEELSHKNNKIKLFEDQLETKKKVSEEELKNIAAIVESVKSKLSLALQEKSALQESCNILIAEKTKLAATSNNKQQDFLKLKTAYEKLCRDHHENKQNLKSLEAKLSDEVKKNEQLQDSNEKKTSKLLLKLEKTEKSIKKIQSQSKSILDSKELQIQTLTMQISSLQASIESERQTLNLVEREKEVLEQNLRDEVFFKNRLEVEYQKKCKSYEEVTNTLNEEIVFKNIEIQKLENVVEEFKKQVDLEKATKVEIKEEYEKHVLELSEKELNNNKNLASKTATIERIVCDLNQEKELKEELSNIYHKELSKLNEEKSKIENELSQQVLENEILQNEMKVTRKEVKELQNEVIKMKSMADTLENKCFDLKETNDNLLEKVEARGVQIEENQLLLEETNNHLTNENEKLSKTLGEKSRTIEALHAHLEHEIKLKEQFESQYTKLQLNNIELEESVSKLGMDMNKIQNELKNKNDELDLINKELEEKETTIVSLNSKIEIIINDIAVVKEELSKAESSKEQLIEENNTLDKNINELNSNISSLEETLHFERETLNIKLAKANVINSELKYETEENTRKINEFQKEINELKEVNQKLLEDSKTQNLLQEKEKLIQELYLKLEEETMRADNIKSNSDMKDTELKKITDDIIINKKELEVLHEQLKSTTDIHEKQLLEKEDIIIALQNKLESEVSEKCGLNEINTILTRSIEEKTEELMNLHLKHEAMCQKIQESELAYQSDSQSFNSALSAKEDELSNLKESLENEIDHKTKSYESALCAKENELINLKEKLKNEVDQKIKSKVHYEGQLETLQQTLAQLTQSFNEYQSSSQLTMDGKVKEIKTLEKQLTDDKVTIEKALKDLEIEIDAEKISKLKMKEDYENHVAKLNKKITNMSNELVVLENSVIRNNEKAEELLSDFIKEKESREELSKRCDIEMAKLNEMRISLENDLQHKLEYSKELQGSLDGKLTLIKEMNTEINELKSSCINLQKDNRVLEEAKTGLMTVVEDRDKTIAEYVKGELVLAELVKHLESQLKIVTNQLRRYINLEETSQCQLLREVSENTILKDNLGSINEEHVTLTTDLSEKVMEVTQLIEENQKLLRMTQDTETLMTGLETKLQEDTMKIRLLKSSTENEISRLLNQVDHLEKVIKDKDLEIQELDKTKHELQNDLIGRTESHVAAQMENKALEEKINENILLRDTHQKERDELKGFIEKLNNDAVIQSNEAIKLKEEIQSLQKAVEQKCEELRISEEIVSKHKKDLMELTNSTNTEIRDLRKQIESLETLNEELDQELKNEMDKKMHIIEALQKDNEQLQFIIEEENSNHELLLKEKEKFIEMLDQKLRSIKDQLELITRDFEEKTLAWEKRRIDADEKIKVYLEKIAKLQEEKEMLLKEIEAVKDGRRELFAVEIQKEIAGLKYSWEKDTQGLQNQVDTTTSDLTHSSLESLKTISDLEKIVQDKNRKITTMQTEITYIKSVMAESGLKLIHVTNELQVSKTSCEELSAQLKKIVQQKNEEIAELKRQVAKMSANENRASQIIKVSAKYQAMILKRIAEIKSTAVLKELTNFGNPNGSGDELRRSLAGSVTMEDLESFLETTDRHLKRCTEKQIALQKDRDRLTEVNRINESELINMKKFLTEMSVSFRTFTTVKEVYGQKLAKIVSIQRTVRRDILSLDGRVAEAAVCKLERAYAAAVQDLAECVMGIERWVERSVGRMVAPEKMKQALAGDCEPAALSSVTYQCAAVEVQLGEAEGCFTRLLAEAARARSEPEAARPVASVGEVRAEYEDKLNRMKAKMKELFHEEMGRVKQRQTEQVVTLERELAAAREQLTATSRSYEQHIRALTAELWSVGEKFLVKQDEADWLRRRQAGASLRSLQYVNSSGLHPGHEVTGRPSDTLSLRSLPSHNNKKAEGRGLHMSDEEGELFDNRFLKELSATPRASLGPNQRVSELKRRNSLVPPHLKSSYPAELQFAPTVDEEDIKCASSATLTTARQRKEVGITAYKKPGPPTPSKQAGRLSATDSELRESLRPEGETGRKTSTPSRLRSLFRSHRPEDENTPRSRRFSNIFNRKK